MKGSLQTSVLLADIELQLTAYACHQHDTALTGTGISVNKLIEPDNSLTLKDFS